MDTRLLEDALILLEERNLTAAAVRRNMTQPAFSRRIRTLEHWIGQDLLVRGANRVELSPLLAKSEPQIRALLGHLRQLHGHLKKPEGQGEPLVLVAQHSLSASAVPEIIQKANAMDMRWRVRLRTQNQDTAMSMFLRHEADVMVNYEYRELPQVPFDDRVSRGLWRRDALVPVVGGALRHQLLEDNVLPEHIPCIVYPAESFLGQIVSLHHRGAARILDGPIAVESAFSVGVAQMVTAGVGAAWVPHSLIHDKIISGEAVILSSDYRRIPMDIALYVHVSNAKARQFQDCLEAGA